MDLRGEPGTPKSAPSANEPRARLYEGSTTSMTATGEETRAVGRWAATSVPIGRHGGATKDRADAMMISGTMISRRGSYLACDTSPVRYGTSNYSLLLLPVVAADPRCTSNHPHSIHPQHRKYVPQCITLRDLSSRARSSLVLIPILSTQPGTRMKRSQPGRPCSPVTQYPPPSCPPRISILTPRTVSTRCLGSCLHLGNLPSLAAQSATIAAISALRAARGGGGAMAARS